MYDYCMHVASARADFSSEISHAHTQNARAHYVNAVI